VALALFKADLSSDFFPFEAAGYALLLQRIPVWFQLIASTLLSACVVF